MNINIDHKKDGTVEISVDILVPREGTVTYTFETNLGNRFYAAFVGGAIEDQFNYKIEKIQRQAYNAGYKDGRAKSKKETWFNNCFNNL